LLLGLVIQNDGSILSESQGHICLFYNGYGFCDTCDES